MIRERRTKPTSASMKCCCNDKILAQSQSWNSNEADDYELGKSFVWHFRKLITPIQNAAGIMKKRENLVVKRDLWDCKIAWRTICFRSTRLNFLYNPNPRLLSEKGFCSIRRATELSRITTVSFPKSSQKISHITFCSNPLALNSQTMVYTNILSKEHKKEL